MNCGVSVGQNRTEHLSSALLARFITGSCGVTMTDPGAVSCDNNSIQIM